MAEQVESIQNGAPAASEGGAAAADLQALLDQNTIDANAAEAEYQAFDQMGLKPELLDGIFLYGFKEPSKIQQLAIVPIASGRDVIAQAQSGTGKTATFGVAILQRIKLGADAPRTPQALVLAPTRELALQSVKVLEGIGNKMKVRVVSLIGGTDVREDEEALRRGCHVVVGTPGRVSHMMKTGALSTQDCSMLVIDEADEMLSHGFSDQVYEILRACNKDTQLVLISATLPREILDLAANFMEKALRILVKESELTLEGIRQYKVDVAQDDWKDSVIVDLFKVLSVQQGVIFCNTIPKVRAVADTLKAAGHTVAMIHAELEQEERSRIMDQFRGGKARTLVATNIIARGIDVQNVSLVINYDIPKNPETYLHRIGRSGRYGRKGVAINLVSEREKASLDRICQTFSIEIHDLPEDIAGLF